MFSDAASNSEPELGFESGDSFTLEEKPLDDILSEIQSESGLKLMQEILYHTACAGSTGLSKLDAHLRGSAASHPSEYSSLNWGDVIELQGPAASGKTQMLYRLVVQCVLPKEITITSVVAGLPSKERIIDIGGWGEGSVVMDTDQHWDVLRLKHILYKHLQSLYPEDYEPFSPSIASVVDECLDKIHIFRPTSSLSLACTLQSLPEYHAQQMPAQSIALLIIDSVSSFFWEDRYLVEKLKNTERSIPNHLSHVLESLQRFRQTYSPVTFLTNWGLSPISKTRTEQGQSPQVNVSPFFRQHLHPFPAPFEVPIRSTSSTSTITPIMHHITLTQRSLPQISLETTLLEDALSAEKQRTDTIMQGTVMGVLRTIERGGAEKFVFHIQQNTIHG